MLDGWWVEGYDGRNGWAIASDPNAEPAVQDEHDATAMLDLIEGELVPRFYDRDGDGVPRAWTAMMKAAIKTAGLHFGAQRMLADYVERVYRPTLASAGG